MRQYVKTLQGMQLKRDPCSGRLWHTLTMLLLGPSRLAVNHSCAANAGCRADLQFEALAGGTVLL
jgi:hypothetical protein